MDQQAINFVLKKHQDFYGDDFCFKSEQEEAITALLQGKDVFVCLPTGYGKSIIPITAVLASDIIDPGSDHMGIIVCPLIALVNDQVKRLKEGGIPAVGLHGSTSSADKQEITAGNTKIIIATPETLLSSRTLLQPLKGKVSLVCADEAHCISEMGLTFRPKYTELGKIFALFQCQILSMTATSTASVCHDILKSLGMITPHIIAHLPDRKDLCFEVASASHSYSQLDWIADELISMKEKSKKIIVFVKTIRESSEIYKFILNKLISSDSSFLKFLNPENRLIDFIHAKMAQSTIDRITNSFSKSDSELRVIISTSVLSMGVNFPDVDIVVLFGLPRSVSQLVQMSGRCARKSGLGLVVVYATKKSMQDITDEWMMKMIGKKDDGSVEVTECQRVSMMSAFCLGDARTAAELESLKVKVCGCKDSCGEICDCALCKCCSFCSMKCPCYRSDQNFIDVHVTNCRMA